MALFRREVATLCGVPRKALHDPCREIPFPGRGVFGTPCGCLPGLAIRRSAGPSRRGFPIKKIAVVLLSLLLVLWGLWLFAVPESLLRDYLRRPLAGRGIALELTGFTKGLFLTLQVERVSISKGMPRGSETSATPPGAGRGTGAAFVVLTDLAVEPDWPSFLKLAPRFRFRGRIGQGRIDGAAVGERGGVNVTVHGEHIGLDSLPILAQSGIHGEGDLAFDFRWEGARGEISFSVADARLSGTLAGNSAVPLNFFRSAKGLFTLENTLGVHSLALEGPGLYVRLKGEIRGRILDGRAEIMVDASFPQYRLLQPLLGRYLVSPGYYLVPLTHIDLVPEGRP